MSGNKIRKLLISVLVILLCNQVMAYELILTKTGILRDPFTVLQTQPRNELVGRNWGRGDLCHEPDWKSFERADAVRLGLCRKPELFVVWNKFQAVAAREGQVVSAYLPTLQLGGSKQRLTTPTVVVDGRPELTVEGDRDVTRRHTLAMNWTLLTFGARTASKNHATLQTKVAKLDFENQIDNVVLEALTAYENLLGSIEVANLLKESLNKAKTNVAMAIQRQRMGVASMSDVMTSEGVVLRARIESERADAEVNQRRVELGYALVLDASELEQLALAKNSVTDTQPIEIGDFQTQLQQHTELQAAQTAFEASKSQLTAVERETRPTLSAYTSYGHVYRTNLDTQINNNKELTVGLQYNISLFTGFSNHYKIKEAQSQSSSLFHQMQAVSERLLSTAKLNVQSLQLEQGQLEHWRKYVDVSLFNMEAMKERYLRGVGDITFVVNAEREAASALAEQARAFARLRVAKWKHLRDMGSIHGKY